MADWLSAVRQFVRPGGASRPRRCPACGRPVRRGDERVSIHGVDFHRACAVYDPAAARDD